MMRAGAYSEWMQPGHGSSVAGSDRIHRPSTLEDARRIHGNPIPHPSFLIPSTSHLLLLLLLLLLLHLDWNLFLLVPCDTSATQRAQITTDDGYAFKKKYI